MRALLMLALAPVAMWMAQSVLLLIAGQRPRWRISAGDLPRGLKRINRGVTYATFAALLAGYPLLRGESPVVCYRGFFPLGERPWEALYGAAASALYLLVLYLVWTLSGNVRFGVRQAPGKLAKRLAGVPFTAVLAALVEELLFRGVLLASLLEDLSVAVAVPIAVVVFAGAHYVRGVKRYWTIGGHLGLGVLFCVAFVCTDALWLSFGLHAGGIVVLMGARPLVRYTGPAWLVGASIFPYAGVVGMIALGLLTLNIWLHYGGVS